MTRFAIAIAVLGLVACGVQESERTAAESAEMPPVSAGAPEEAEIDEVVIEEEPGGEAAEVTEIEVDTEEIAD